MHYRAKADKIQPEVVKALRDIGCSVLHLHAIGSGAPDIAAAKHMITVLFEIKSGKGYYTKDSLTQPTKTLQKKFADEWRGHVYTVSSPQQAVSIMLGITQGEQ